MASDTRPGDGPPEGTPPRPWAPDPEPGPGEGDDGTGVWDAAQAWEEEGRAGGPPRPASEEHWVRADWSARSDDYVPGEVTYYGPELEPTPYGPSALEPEFEPDEPDYGPVTPGYGTPRRPLTPGTAPYPSGPGDPYPPGPALDPYPSGPGLPLPPGRSGGPGGPGAHGGGRRSGNPWPALVVITAVAVAAAAAILAVTTNKPSGTANNLPVTTPASPPATTAPPRTTAPTTTTTLPSGSTTVDPGSLIAFSVPANPSWEAGLVTSFITAEGAQGITLGDVNGEVPGEVEFAYMPSTATYWGLAEFQPSATLKAQASTAPGQAKMSFFANTQYAFSWQDGKTWTLLGDVPTGDCPGIWVPRAVLAVWSLCGLHPPRTPPGT
jgi:hypothetical protein